MSEHYEVPSHHEHALEHQAHSGHGLSQQIAIFTAIMATLGAVISYQSGHTQNEALYYKNDAVLNRTLASDQWAYYQAKSIKQHIAETAAAESADPQHVTAFKAEAQRYGEEKDALKAKAEGYEQAAEAANAHAERALHPHERLAFAMTLIQIAISAASITALTRRRWLFALAGLSAAAGIGVWGLAFFL